LLQNATPSGFGEPQLLQNIEDTWWFHYLRLETLERLLGSGRVLPNLLLDNPFFEDIVSGTAEEVADPRKNRVIFMSFNTNQPI